MAQYLCAIAPLDQASTGIGWQPGAFLRDPCGIPPCGWTDHALQFLADPGTPVLTPMPMTVVSTSPLKVRPSVEVSPTWSSAVAALRTNSDITITGLTPAVIAGAQLDKGVLLGRIAPGQRGTKWSLEVQPILGFFQALGLEVVGSSRPDQAGYRLTPNFGGRLLARSSGPAGGACAPSGALHGLHHYGLGSAPTGFVDPQSSPYARYGPSSQTDTSIPPPHQNISPAQAGAAAGGGLLALAAAAGLFWWWSKG